MNYRDLLIYNVYPAPSDKINTYASPEISWYNIQFIKPNIITGYKDWKEHIQSMSDFWIEKNNEGMLITDKVSSTATNPTVGNNY